MQSSENPPSIEEIFKIMRSVEHDPNYCATVAATVAKMLITGDAKDLKPITKKNAVIDDEADIIEKVIGTKGTEKTASSPDEFLRQIDDAISGTIFVVSTADDEHVYNILKYGESIYLIDNDLHNYKQINDQKDCVGKVPEREKNNFMHQFFGAGPSEFNYLDFDEDEDQQIVFYEVGTLHEKWMPKQEAEKRVAL